MTNKVIELNGEDYLICSDVVIDNVNYLYVVSMDGKRYSVLKREVTATDDTVESITDETMIKKVLEMVGAQENI